MGNIKMISYRYELLLLSLACLAFACNPASESSLGAKNEAQQAFRSVQTQQEAFPPDDFVNDLKHSASDVVLVTLTRVDSVANTTKIFSAKVVETYKGNINKNEILKFAGTSERVYAKPPLDTLVVFLTKHQNALPHLKSHRVYYSTVEDNASIKPSPRLDSLLKKP